MCGRFTVTGEADAIGEAFAAEIAPLRDVRLPRYNIAPTDDVPVVIAAPEGRRAGPMRWGLVPHWADGPRIGARMINARSESVATRSAYRESFLARRCLVPADGFYEWEARADGKQPYWIHRPGRGLFAMAGIWALWRPAGGAPEQMDGVASAERSQQDRETRTSRGSRLATFSVLTRPAPAALGWLHDRVPVILPVRTWDDWLARGTPADALNAILAQSATPELRLHAVSRAVNKPGCDEPGCVEEVLQAVARKGSRTLAKPT